jgi:LPS export ABC transporter protein LptC
MPRFLRKHWPPILIAALVGVVFFYFMHSGKGGIRAPEMNQMTGGEGLRLKDIHYTHDDTDGNMKWVLDAEEVTFSKGRDAMKFSNFCILLEPLQKPWLEMKGDRGEYSRETGEIRLWGGLEGRSENGYRIETDRIFINEKSREMRTDELVRISGPLFSVKGKGMVADMREERIRILSDVTTVLSQEAWSQ